MFPIRDSHPTWVRPWVTILLIAGSLYVFFGVQQFETQSAEEEFLYRYAAIACEVRTNQPVSQTEILTETCTSEDGPQAVFPDKSPLTSVLTSIFLHGGVAHVLFNMWFLWIFGNNVEEAFGPIKYLALYLIGGVAATAAFVVLNPASTVPLVGASGAIAAVLGAYAVLFPSHRILSLVGWFFVPVPAALFLGVWFFAQFGLGGGNVAWEAHVGGFVFGFLVALMFRRPLLNRVRRMALAR